MIALGALYCGRRMWEPACASLLAFGIVTACGHSAARPAATPRPTPVVFVDVQGKCPLHPSAPSLVCRTSKVGNALAGRFALPLNAWGIAYGFNCGPAPSDLFVLVGLPSMDAQMPETGFVRHGRTGRGVFMETGKGVVAWKALPKVWQWPEDLVIASTCAWHLRAVHGSRAVVSRHIPAVPHA